MRGLLDILRAFESAGGELLEFGQKIQLTIPMAKQNKVIRYPKNSVILKNVSNLHDFKGIELQQLLKINSITFKVYRHSQ